MTVYENKNDRELELKTILSISKYISDTFKDVEHVKLKQTPTLEHYDFEIYFDKKIAGLGEIKTRNYDTKFFEREGWVLDIKRIESIKKELDRLGIVMCMYVLRTSDDNIFVVSNGKLRKNIHLLKKANQKCMKDDHGKKESDRTGFIVPFELLTKI